jgi:hypothetical protein
VTCCSNLNVLDMFPSIGSAGRRFAFLHRVLRGEFPCFNGTIKALRLPTAHPAALRCLRLAVPRLHSLFSLPDGRVRRRGLELVTRYLQPGFAEETTGPPKFLGNLNCPFAHVPIRRRWDCSHQTVHSAAAWPLVIERQRLPRQGLSTLNSMAFGLAVYASPGSLPPHDARLASGCWSGSTGRAFHPQGSTERFQISFLHLILLSQALLGAIDVTRVHSRSYVLRGGRHDPSRLASYSHAPLS